MKKLSDQHNSHTLVGCLLMPPIPHAAIPIAAAPASLFLKTGKLGYHRGASWIKSAFPYIMKGVLPQ